MQADTRAEIRSEEKFEQAIREMVAHKLGVKSWDPTLDAKVFAHLPIREWRRCEIILCVIMQADGSG
jgi:hypothetical protein